MTSSVQNNYSANNNVHNQYSAKAENGHKKKWGYRNTSHVKDHPESRQSAVNSAPRASVFTFQR